MNEFHKNEKKEEEEVEERTLDLKLDRLKETWTVISGQSWVHWAERRQKGHSSVIQTVERSQSKYVMRTA